MSKTIDGRLRALEAVMPGEIILLLDNGSQFRHCGPPLRFYSDSIAEIRLGHGPLLDAVRRTVEAQGCGLLWQVLAAVANSPV